MQQYRVNFALLIGLFVGTLVCSSAVYALWKFQLGRNAGALLSDGEKALEEGNYRLAVRYYANYLSIRGDDNDARIKLANAYADLTEQDDVSPEEFGTALQVLENTVRRLPEATALRKRLAEFYYRVGRYQDALDHLGYLLPNDPDNVELQAMRAEYLIRAGSTGEAIDYANTLIGYDPETDTFDAEKATAPHEVDVYTRLAVLLRTQRDEPELAKRIMNQMIQENADSAAAYLRRGQYYINVVKEDETGEPDVQKAYELDPQDADVLLSVADRASEHEQYDKAREHLEAGKKLYPEDIRFYQALASLGVKQHDYDQAMAEVSEGLKAVVGQKARILLVFKFDLQFRATDVEGMRQTVDEMRKASFRPEYIEWSEAQIMLAERKWFAASEALNRLRPRVSDFGNLATQIDVQLGLCYEKLGQFELALPAYNLVLQQDPLNEPALAGKQRMLSRLDREVSASPVGQSWQQVLTDELQRPREDRDWPRIDEMVDKAVEKGELEGVNLVLLKANLKLAQEDYDAARQLLQQANEMSPDNLQAYRLLVQLARFDPSQGADKAMELLARVVKKFGDQSALRLDRADLYIAIHDDQMAEQMSALADGIDDWSDEEKVALWNGLAIRCVNLGMGDRAQLYWNHVADVRPNDLPTRLTLFSLALDANDDAGIEAAQNKILEIVKDKNDDTWLYTEARRLLSLVRRRRLPIETSDEIRSLVDKAMKQRPDWINLHLVLAELALLEGKPDEALVHYERAEKLGRPYVGAIVQHIGLLVQRGQFQRAKELVERLPKESRQRLLGQTYSEILLRTNDVDAAIAEARSIVDVDPDNAQNELWYGQLLARASQLPTLSDTQRADSLKSATEALQRALRLNPELVEGWYLLVSCHVLQEERDEALQVMRNAQLTLSGDLLPQFLARSYEMLGYWFDAENMYRMLYDATPDDVSRAKQLAAFYLGRVYPLKDVVAKVTPLINQILRAGAEGKIAPDDPNLQWARRQGALLLAAEKDYQKLRKAENLLASNAQSGFLSVEDRLQMAHILSSRPEPKSRLKAVQLLEAVSAERSLDLASELTLGRLYYSLGDWPKCRRQMRQTIGRFPDAPQPRDSYVRMLLARGNRREYNDAIPQVSRLRELVPNSPSTIELTVRLSNKIGKQKEARDELLRLLPRVNRASDVTDDQAAALDLVARLLAEELEDYDDAEKIYRLLAARTPSKTLDLAVFLGRHRDVGQCFQELEKVYAVDRLPQLIQAALAVEQERRDDVGDKYDQQLQTWFDRALLENPDSIAVLLQQAEFYDLQQEYDKATDIYRRLLTRNDLTGDRRAIVLNNLSYLLALAGSDASSDTDALKLVQEASQILGPTTDILDTRAVAYIARKDYRRALEDLELAVLDTPTPTKYFHKAVAHVLAGENKAALESWEKAEELGLTRGSLNRIEHGRYDDMKAKIDELRTRSAADNEVPTLTTAGR